MPALRAGEKVTTPGRTIGESDVNLFAGLVGDFTPIHVDAEAAAASPHGTRIAHGPLAMATAIGMLTQTGLLGERVIGLHVGDVVGPRVLEIDHGLPPIAVMACLMAATMLG